MIEEEQNSPQSSDPSPQDEGAPAEPSATEGAAPEEEEGPAQEEAAASEQPPEDEETSEVEETPAEEPTAEEAPADEPASEEADEAPETLSPKARRKRSRSQFAGAARPQRSPEERQQERVERRGQRAEARRRWRRRARERTKGAPSAEPIAPVERAHGKPRVRQGVVVSDRADKTITVRIDMQRAHRTYGKVVRTSSTLHAHDEGNQAHVGDKVTVVESRPLSRTKRWRLVEVLERAR